MKKEYIQPELVKVQLNMLNMIAQSAVVNPGEEVEAGDIEGKRRTDKEDNVWAEGLW